VEQDDDSGKYRLGLAVVRLGGHAERTLDLRSSCHAGAREPRPHGRGGDGLSRTLEGDTVLTIAYSDGHGHEPRPIRATTRLSMRRRRARSSWPTKPEREVIRLSKIGFTPYTSHTIVRVDLLLRRVGRVRRRGFRHRLREFEPTVNAIAVPLFISETSVVAALGGASLGPSDPPEPRAGLVERARETAA